MTMKIGIVCPYDYFRHGGVQEHVRAVAEELRLRGHNVKVITIPPPDGINKEPENVITLGSATMINAPDTSFEISASATPSQIDDMLEREQFDIIHYHEPMLPLLPGQILSRSNAINIATFHAHKTDDIMSRSLDLIHLPYHRNRAKFINYVTAVSEAAAVYVSKAEGQNIHIVPNGIKLKRFKPEQTDTYKEFDDDVKTILHIGRLEKRKGAEYLLRAYEELKEKDPNTRLVIAGDGPRLKALKTYVDQYDVQDVHFLGFVSEEDKLQLLKTCDLFVSAALYGESFGIVLLEAMAMGAPMIAGDNDGYVSVLKEVGRISLVNPKHQTEFVRRMELVLSEDKLRTLLINWGLEYVQQFDYARVTDQYLEIYENLLNEQK